MDMTVVTVGFGVLPEKTLATVLSGMLLFFIFRKPWRML